MKMADGAIRPAWNVQGATAQGFVVTIEPTDRRNDSGLAAELVAQIERRSGVSPVRLLADGTAMAQDEIVSLADHHPRMTVYTPVPTEREDVTAETLRKRQWQREREPVALRDWRERMASAAGQLVYRGRKLTEHAHAKMKSRGFARMPVHSLAKVRVVCLLHALAHNLTQAHWARAATVTA